MKPVLMHLFLWYNLSSETRTFSFLFQGSLVYWVTNSSVNIFQVCNLVRFRNSLCKIYSLFYLPSIEELGMVVICVQLK